MSKRLFKTLVAVLAIAAAAAGPVRGQTTYNVTFGGFNNPAVNTTVSVASLPQTINFYPFAVISNGSEFISANVTSGGNGKVSVNAGWNQMAITISGTFEGTATIHVVCSDPQENPVSSDITVACTLPPVPITVRMAEGTEDAANWSIASGNASVTGNQVLENVMSGSQVTATYNGTTKKVKSVKAVKYVAPPTPLDNTTTAWTAGTFAVPEGGLTYSDAITVSGDVTLTLTDGTTLTLNKGISLAEGATLTIQGNGTMNVNGTNNSTASTVAGSTGTLILTSGTLTARGGNGGSVGDFNDHSHGGNGGNAINGSVIVSGGTLTARGGNGGSVGEASDDCSGGNGGDAISGTLTINGGSTSVNNGSNGSIGEDCEDCTAGTGGKAVAGTVTDNR